MMVRMLVSILQRGARLGTVPFISIISVDGWRMDVYTVPKRIKDRE